MIPRRCRDCGVVLQSEQRTYCDECVPGIRIEGFDQARAKATATLAQARAEGKDPAHGGEAATKRAQTLARRIREAKARETETSSRPDPDTFVREILPGLKTVSVRAMAGATGLTRGYCSMIRRGLYVPHARHWAALRRLSRHTPNRPT